MKIRIPIGLVFKPSSLSMFAVSASFAAWIFPSFGVLQKGFETPSKLDLTSILVLALWYLLIFSTFFVGQKIGQLIKQIGPQSIDPSISLDSNRIYYLYTLLATIGVAAMLAGIFRSLSLQQAILRISLGETNALKDALYEDYSVGFASLRYLVLYPASLALYRIIRFRDYGGLNCFNVALLAVSTFLSSRLMLIATVISTTYLLSCGVKYVKLHVLKISAVLAALFLVLSALNISRNAEFYQRNHLSFWLAGVNEIDAYLGTPFQVAVGSADVTDQLAAGGTGVAGVLGSEPYRRYVDIEINYMTNSAFVHLHQQVGYLAWPYMAILGCCMGFTFEALAGLGRTIFLLPCGAILYASAELWRLDLFEQGTFIIWFVVGIGLPAFLFLMQRMSRFLHGIYRMPTPLE